MESLTCCIVSEGEDWICDTERSVDGVVENKSLGVDDCGAVGVSRLVAKDSSWALNLPLSPRGHERQADAVRLQYDCGFGLNG